jgi:hypothetical protein
MFSSIVYFIELLSLLFTSFLLFRFFSFSFIRFYSVFYSEIPLLNYLLPLPCFTLFCITFRLSYSSVNLAFSYFLYPLFFSPCFVPSATLFRSSFHYQILYFVPTSLFYYVYSISLPFTSCLICIRFMHFPYTSLAFTVCFFILPSLSSFLNCLVTSLFLSERRQDTSPSLKKMEDDPPYIKIGNSKPTFLSSSSSFQLLDDTILWSVVYDNKGEWH